MIRLTLLISTRRSSPAMSTPTLNAVADRHQQTEQQERDEDRQDRERRAELAAPDVLPDERQELHAALLAREHAFVEVQRPVGALRRVRIVRHHDDGLAVVAVQRLQQVEDLVAGLAIEVAGRLVAQQQRRIGDDRARDADALLLAAGQLARIVLRAVGEADDLQGDRGALPPLAPATASSAAAAARRSSRRSAPAAGCRAGRRSRCGCARQRESCAAAQRADAHAADLDRAAASAGRGRPAGSAASSCPSPTAPSAPGSRPAQSRGRPPSARRCARRRA